MARLLHVDLKGLTWSSLLIAFGGSMVGVFVPLLLLSNGLERWQIIGLYALGFGWKLGVEYPCVWLLERYGSRFATVIGASCMVATISLLGLYVSLGHWSWLFAWIIVASTQDSLLWNARLWAVSHLMDDKRKNIDVAIMELLRRVAAAPGPIVGGYVAMQLGQVVLTVFAAVVLAVAILPIWRVDKKIAKSRSYINRTKLRPDIRDVPWRDMVAKFGFSVHALIGVMVWPIFVVESMASFREVGVYMTIAELCAALVLLPIGLVGDRGQKGWWLTLVVSTACVSAVHLSRLCMPASPVAIMIIAALYSIAMSCQHNPWISAYHANIGRGSANYLLWMELTGDVAYLLTLGTLSAVAYFGGDAVYYVAFAMAGLSAWLCLLIRPR